MVKYFLLVREWNVMEKSFGIITGKETVHHNRFLILSRDHDIRAQRLHEILSTLGEAEVIVDSPNCGGVWYDNQQAKGYEGVLGIKEFPQLSAWSRAFCHLHYTLDDRRVWFVEDDVAGSMRAFHELVDYTDHREHLGLAATSIRSKNQDPDWYWWPLAGRISQEMKPMASFNPLCCLSPGLVEDVLKFRNQRGALAFIELMLPMIAVHGHRRTLDWNQSEVSRLFENFHYRPVITQTLPGICHPVKDRDIHGEICNQSFKN